MPSWSLEIQGFIHTLQHSSVLLSVYGSINLSLNALLQITLCLLSNQWKFSFIIQLEQERREAEMRAKREEEERKRQEELRRQQEEILRRQQEEERKRREEEELARRKQVCLWELCT